MEGKWSYINWSVSFCFQDLFKTAHNILVQFSCSFFPESFVWVQVVELYSSTYTATTKKDLVEQMLILKN